MYETHDSNGIICFPTSPYTYLPNLHVLLPTQPHSYKTHIKFIGFSCFLIELKNY